MKCHVFPVIHHLDEETTLSEADIAFACGATGVFLISHGGQDLDLLPLAKTIKGRTGKYVGINLLRHTAAEALEYATIYGLDGVWADDCGVSSKGTSSAGDFLADLSENSNLDVFASVAFKYQPDEPNPPLAAIEALRLGWIPTTSGSGTGHAPEVEKIKSMYEATKAGGDLGLLAIASGMTPENVANYVPYLTHILVSTGVSSDAYHFDPIRLKQLISIVNAF